MAMVWFYDLREMISSTWYLNIPLHQDKLLSPGAEFSVTVVIPFIITEIHIDSRDSTSSSHLCYHCSGSSVTNLI